MLLPRRCCGICGCWPAGSLARAHLVRLLAGWFEVANICGHARTLSGNENEASFTLVRSGAPGPVAYHIVACRTEARAHAISVG